MQDGSEYGPKAEPYKFCGKHNISLPCPVCADRAAIWDLVRLVRAWCPEYSSGEVLLKNREAIQRAERGI